MRDARTQASFFILVRAESGSQDIRSFIEDKMHFFLFRFLSFLCGTMGRIKRYPRKRSCS